MKKSCDEFLILIKDDLAGELDGSRKAALESHLENCQTCQLEQEKLVQSINVLKQFEDQSVPNHFFVYDPKPHSLLERFRELSTRFRWIYALGTAAAILLVGFILVNTQIQIGKSRLILAFGESAAAPTEEDLRAEFLMLLQQSREEDRRLLVGLLEEQNKQFRGAMRQYYQQVDNRFTGLESRLLETIDNSNTSLQSRLERTIYQYGQLLKADQESSLKQLDRRLTQIALEGRMRDSKTGAFMARLARLADPDNRTIGGMDD